MSIPDEFRGWWRILETGTWTNDGLDMLGPALISFTDDWREDGRSNAHARHGHAVLARPLAR